MGKINELLVEATEYRITEMCCEWDEAWDWALDQSIEGLLNYVEERREKPDLSIDVAISWYESRNDLNKYEKIALETMKDYVS